MHGLLICSALLSALTGITAAPVQDSAGSSNGTAVASGQVAFKFPLSNGFPNIKNPSAELRAIEEAAVGILPNAPLSKHLASADVTNFQLIGFAQLFQVAYYTSLYNNITQNVPGYDVPAQIKPFFISVLEKTIAQEELHLLSANAILRAAGQEIIQPCRYVFPFDNFFAALDFATIFSDVIIGTYQTFQTTLALNGDSNDIALLGSIMGSTAERNGYLRSLLGANPAELPFLSISTGPWAYAALTHHVIVKDSCPNANIINVPSYGDLFLTNSSPNVSLTTTELAFAFINNGKKPADLRLVYTNAQNVPIAKKLENVKTTGNFVSFTVPFDYSSTIMSGMTMCWVASTSGDFSSANGVTAASLFGPAILNIN
ncbi:hypothetical protein AUEXF2481DRAFT_82691 [Aureobasidium subglaciale EXF-2481]|uniref:Late sexual development protein n=1 Tax=Aureobasidium subglaciale (strain EXF-2481) TaxID=1043005 RepID=A0A074YDH2_AURSE|nr:uncharacterized protein AUEXF2481DRAFT_82691 [Aureobasidium subglaciale EXF-2481]KAI5207177.1 hypothetical protein E4T38_03344 [Aureobasidium subglaciale]KAI5226252.1 hypothetical protein E4T40_03279 [Aureobasidium subglaciale]KAI5229493.1 hypothetical protein E4T41_03341 [Aureobasidium subglaciale]KAI5264197.1 hypothetical protein E4T46_03119 [Aureobasidium subglaciale]KEQ92112.1 hypothetical protein AUEXF2481DRAFT_82691 [Aureobasidium subglaciale EXF-2481]